MSERVPHKIDYRPLLLAGIVAVAATELGVTWLALHPQVTANYRAYYIDKTTTCLNKPVSGTYTIGATVSFMPDDQVGARKLRVCGWDGPGGDGTHSVGTSSRLRFAVPAPRNDLTLRLQLAAVTAPDNRSQQIVLTAANGTGIGEATVAAGDTATLDFAVPAAAIDASRHRLDVIMSFPDAAQMTPLDSDVHYRAIKLMAVQLRGSNDPPSRGPKDDLNARPLPGS